MAAALLRLCASDETRSVRGWAADWGCVRVGRMPRLVAISLAKDGDESRTAVLKRFVGAVAAALDGVDDFEESLTSSAAGEGGPSGLFAA